MRKFFQYLFQSSTRAVSRLSPTMPRPTSYKFVLICWFELLFSLKPDIRIVTKKNGHAGNEMPVVVIKDDKCRDLADWKALRSYLVTYCVSTVIRLSSDTADLCLCFFDIIYSFNAPRSFLRSMRKPFVRKQEASFPFAQKHHLKAPNLAPFA